jgi:sterol desaturase/sphingolipid hydroxylase (fatty acid hydroxylase superfamily)
MPAILARLVPSEPELFVMSVTTLEGTRRARRLRLKRKVQKAAFVLISLGLGWLLGDAVALPMRLVRGLYTPLTWWFWVYVPLCFFLCVFALVFHVERSYRRFGL